MNRKPDTSGISRYWKDGDDRRRLAKLLALSADAPRDRKRVDGFLDAFLRMVRTRRRTSIVGFGVFEWRRWNIRIPTGEMVETWRLVFRPARTVRKRLWK